MDRRFKLREKKGSDGECLPFISEAPGISRFLGSGNQTDPLSLNRPLLPASFSEAGRDSDSLLC